MSPTQTPPTDDVRFLAAGGCPVPGAAVRVVVDGQPFEAYADEIADGWIDLLAARGAIPHVVLDRGATGVTVEYLVDDDVWRLLGDLSFFRQESAGTVWRFDFAHTPQLLLRRNYVRAPLAAGVRLWPAGGRVETQTLDVSGGGMRVGAGLDAEVGDDVGFVLSLPGRPPIRGSAEVVRADDDGSTALSFTHIGDGDRTVLVLAVYDEQRRAKARG
jgi:hypothetical protein